MGERMVIVVGAGASREFGLPMGNELKERIAEHSSFQKKDNEYRPGDSKISDAAHACAQFAGGSPITYFDAFNEISEALPLAISIDNYLDVRKSDPLVVQCGKISIVREILEAERLSKLYLPKGRHLGLTGINCTWIAEFFKVLTENCMLEDVAGRLKGITFVIFNYDRCIEHFFFHALQIYYRINAEEAGGILSHANFLHPYGTLGSLPWQKSRRCVEYGADIPAGELVEVAKGILTFTESTHVGASDLTQIREAIATTPMLIFLGFAFHRINMRLLFSDLKNAVNFKQIYGTAFMVSNFDTKYITHELGSKFKCEPELRNDLVCDKLFGEYSRAISLGI